METETIRYAIVEDEHFAQENLRGVVEKLRPNYALTFTAESVEDTIELLSANSNLDLLFLDIELDDGNCFEIFDQIEVHTPIIFTTAYNEYAIRAFKVNSIDYLMKPISEEAVGQALRKFELLRSQTATASPQIDYARLAAEIQHESGQQKRVLVTSGDNYGYIDIKDVAYFISEDKYVFACQYDGRRRLTTYNTLNDVEADFSGNEFFRVSRNIVAAIEAIGTVHKFFNGRLVVSVKAGDKKTDVVVSAARRDAFLKWMGGGKV